MGHARSNFCFFSNLARAFFFEILCWGAEVDARLIGAIFVVAEPTGRWKNTPYVFSSREDTQLFLGCACHQWPKHSENSRFWVACPFGMCGTSMESMDSNDNDAGHRKGQ